MKVLEQLSDGFDSEVVRGEVHHCPVHPDVLSTKQEGACSECQRGLVPRRIPYSFIHARAETPHLKLNLEPHPAPEVGETTRLRIQLQYADESPVLETDLWPMHTEIGQVLVTGPDLSDFRHLALEAGEEPGHYGCDFRPRQAGKHRLHVVLTPYLTGLPEFHSSDLEVAGANASPERKRPPVESLSSLVEDGQFHLSVGGTKGRQLRSGELQLLQLQVFDAEGQPVQMLEPFRNAFAHITAFYTENGPETGETVLQLHPTGGDILQDVLRGGPSLAFKIYSPRAGLLRLFCEVQLNGKRILAPFYVRIVE